MAATFEAARTTSSTLAWSMSTAITFAPVVAKASVTAGRCRRQLP